MSTRSIVTPDGISLHAVELGPERDPPVVVLHGGPAAHHDYLLPAFARLADAFRLVLYDQRGGGRSRTAPDVPLTLAAHLGDLEAVIDATGGARADLLGYSFGGLIAMLFAARKPERVRKLVLCSSAAPHHGFRGPLDQALAAAQRSPWVVEERAALERSGLKETLPDEYRRRRFALSVAGYFADPRLCYGLTPFRVQQNAAEALVADLGPYDFREEMTALPAGRTLFVHGDVDPIPVELLEETARRAGARFERLTSSGHVPYVEAPERLFSILRAFLEE